MRVGVACDLVSGHDLNLADGAPEAHQHEPYQGAEAWPLPVLT